jgi:hypothetical protein
MLKRNLFAIIITGLGLFLTSNAFGQWHPEIDRINSPKDLATGQIKSPRDSASGQSSGLITEITFPAVANQRSKTTNQYNPKEWSIDKIASRKSVKWEVGEYDAIKNSSVSPRSNLRNAPIHQRRRKN